MPLYDLHCTACGHEVRNVMTPAGEWGTCAKCQAPMTWTPFVFATDVRGCETVSSVLDESRDEVTGHNRPLSWTSTREREQKMKRMGFEPAGDRVGGARNSDGYKGTIFSRP